MERIIPEIKRIFHGDDLKIRIKTNGYEFFKLTEEETAQYEKEQELHKQQEQERQVKVERKKQLTISVISSIIGTLLILKLSGLL